MTPEAAQDLQAYFGMNLFGDEEEDEQQDQQDFDMEEQKLRQLVREEIQTVLQESDSDMFALARVIGDLSDRAPEIEDLGRDGDIHKFRIGRTEYYATTTDKAGQHTMP